MRPARIRAFAKTASDLAHANNQEAAFVLRWIAYEGLIIRASIKALWMRGASVKKAEKFMLTYNLRKKYSFLSECCAHPIAWNSKRVKALSRIKEREDLRHLLFHQLNIPSTKKLLQFSTLLARTLNNPEMVFGMLEINLGAIGRQNLGDPLVDLRKN